MEKHRCKLCYRKFSNGRALGGHMRSHMINLPVPLKPEFLSFSLSSSSDSDSEPEPEPEEGEIVKDKLLCKLRKKPMVDESGGSSSVTLQDKESDTESSKNVTRRRSKRTRKPVTSILQHSLDYNEYYYNDVEQQQQQQLGSSISEVTSEEDVAFCLMMMSRDTWSDNRNKHGLDQRHENDFNFNFDDGGISVPMSHKKKYKCDTCNKAFKSYQALGGHRASHKKTRVTDTEIVDNNNNNEKKPNVVAVREDEKKIHECPICFRVFASGQALGGHKRSHVIGNNNHVKSQVNVVQTPKKKKKVIDEIMIDLNLPAPIDDDYDEDYVNQIDTSKVYTVHP